LLAVVDGAPPSRWLPHGAAATLDSYGFRGDLTCIPEEHVAFFRGLLPYVETDKFLFVHANYDPKLPMDQQPDELLRWTNLKKHLPGPHVSGKIAIVGHTAQTEGHIIDIGHLRCIDTCCYGGQWLTMMDVPADRVWQADPDGNLRLE
jgi:serine/threonine protein phosphatase 1